MRLRTLFLLATVGVTVVATAAPALASPASAPRVTAVDAVVGAPADVGLSCVASFTVWSGGYFATVTVHNGGSVTVTGWAVTFTLPANLQISGGWNATLTISGRKVVIQPGPWNGALTPGSTTSAGFSGSYTGVFVPPSDMNVNGVPCTVQIS